MPARRRFLATIAGTAAALGLSSTSALASGHRADDSLADGDAWMKPLKGKHRQFFHAMTMAEEPLRMANNFLDAYRDAFKAPEGHVNAVIGVHGSALSLGFNDELWKKYELGKMVKLNDPETGAPALRNVYARGGAYTVESVQKRGVVILMCNTALRNRATAMSKELGVSYETMYAELSAARLPGVTLVPAMVVAVSRAQENGFTYIRAS